MKKLETKKYQKTYEWAEANRAVRSEKTVERCKLRNSSKNVTFVYLYWSNQVLPFTKNNT